MGVEWVKMATQPPSFSRTIRSMAVVTRSYSWATLSPPSGWARPMSVIQMWWLSG